MTAPAKSTAVVTTTESSLERPAVPYVLRSRAALILNADDARAAIAPFVPAGTNWELVLAEVHRCATNNPEILDCTPPSIIQAVGQAVQTGLVIGKTIHLVPVNTKVGNGYEKRLQAWPDYKGDIELVLWSGAARDVHAAAVRKNDTFDFGLGDDPWIRHTWKLGVDRGEIVGGYFIAKLDAYGKRKKVIVAALAEIEKVRAGSKQWNPTKVRECPEWYVEKTLYHRGCKTLPKSPRLAAVIAMMDAREQHERGEDFVGEDLDPSRQIASVAHSSTSSEGGKEATPAVVATPREFEPEPVATTKPNTAYLFPLPFGRESKGKPIGEMDQQKLVDAYTWAKEQDEPEHQYPEFIAAAEDLLEQRRLASEAP